MVAARCNCSHLRGALDSGRGALEGKLQRKQLFCRAAPRPEAALRVAGTIARVPVDGPDGISVGYGAGFLLSPRSLLTNWHVLKTAENARLGRRVRLRDASR